MGHDPNRRLVSRQWLPRALFCLTLGVACAAVAGCFRHEPPLTEQGKAVQQELFAALRPSGLANCTLRRYGDAHDGGYLMCENLMGDARAAYSYGIDGRDQWGCEVSRQLRTPVHEYDCFNTTRPACQGGTFLFHEECIGDQKAVQKGRPFDTLSNQLARNGDADKRLIVKMDVEGSEWDSLLATPESDLERIDQLVIEFHGTDDPKFVETVEKLKRHFYVAHFHANNYSCNARHQPLTAWANEVLFVNKRIGVLSEGTPVLPNPLDAPNNPSHRDCQPLLSQ